MNKPFEIQGEYGRFTGDSTYQITALAYQYGDSFEFNGVREHWRPCILDLGKSIVTILQRYEVVSNKNVKIINS
jgi:hypothetical protein